MSNTPVTARLAEFCRTIRYDDIPPDAVEVARQCLLDWLGVTIAGSSEPLAEMLRDEVLDEGGNAQATLVGSGHQVTAKQAALVNGAASHALDYDDVNLAMSGHPSVPIGRHCSPSPSGGAARAVTCSPRSPPGTRWSAAWGCS